MPSRAIANPQPEFGTELVRDWIPDGQPKAHIVLVHGIAEHSGRYERTGDLLAEAGYHVRGFDLRGAGGSGGRRWDVETWTQYHDQVQTHVEWAKSQNTPVVLMGHSLGGAICLGYLLDVSRPQPDVAVLSAPALTGGAGWQRTLAPIAARIAPTVALANPVDGGHLSRDPAVAEAYFADPLVVTKTTFRLGAAIFAEMDRLNAGLGRLTVPTLVIHGGDDRLVATASSERLGELEVVDRVVYDGLRHETLNEPEGPEVVADVVEWLDRRLAGT
jgi:alpha-beta hydrolase superfamily lysophospholipase